MQIKDKIIMISGAGSGLGYAVAKMVIENGGKAILLDINQAAGEAAQNNLGNSSIFIPTDVTSEKDAKHAIETTIEKFGRIDGLVNCAGVAPGEKIIGRDGPHKLESFSRAISINLIGTFNMLRLVSETMSTKEPDDNNERGIIINTASIAAFDGQIGQVAYSASKGGVVGLTLPAARELARYGIRVVTIAPGIFETPMLAGLPQDVQEALGAQVPFPPRLGKPSEYASLVKHIFENSMLNGEVIRLDGALRMAPK